MTLTLTLYGATLCGVLVLIHTLMAFPLHGTTLCGDLLFFRALMTLTLCVEICMMICLIVTRGCLSLSICFRCGGLLLRKLMALTLCEATCMMVCLIFIRGCLSHKRCSDKGHYFQEVVPCILQNYSWHIRNYTLISICLGTLTNGQYCLPYLFCWPSYYLVICYLEETYGRV